MAGAKPPQVLRGIGLATSAIELPRQGPALLHTRHLDLHLFRGALLMLTSILAFLSLKHMLKHMPVGEFTGIVLLTPLVASGRRSAGTLSAVYKIYRPKRILESDEAEAQVEKAPRWHDEDPVWPHPTSTKAPLCHAP